MRMRDGLARGIAVGEQFAHPLPPAPRHWGAPTPPPDAAARCRRSLRAASKGGRRAGEGGGTWRGHGQGPLKELHNLASFCQKSVLGQSKVAYHDRCNRPHIPRELAPTTAPPPPSVWKPLKHVRKSPLGPPRGKRSCDRPEDSRFRRLLAQSNRSRAAEAVRGSAARGPAVCGKDMRPTTTFLQSRVIDPRSTVRYHPPSTAAPNRRHESQICVARALAVHTGPWPIAVEPLPTGSSPTFAALAALRSQTPPISFTPHVLLHELFRLVGPRSVQNRLYV
jgi:hypothetical protein